MAYIGNSPGVASQRIVTTFTATASQTTFTPTSGYTVGYLDVYLNGVKLINGEDYTASNGSTFVLASGAASGDVIEAVAYLPRGLSDGYTKAEADARYVNASGDTMTGNLDVTGTVTADGLTVDGTADVDNLIIDNSGKISSVGQIELQVDTDNNQSGTYIGFSRNNTTSERLALFSENGDISFYEDTGTTAKFFWDASAESLGIGTTWLDGQLHVNSSSETVASITSEDAVSAAKLQIGFFNTALGWTEGLTISKVRAFSGSAEYDVDTSGSGHVFKTQGTERMRIDSSGRVTMPYQPFFNAKANTNQTLTAGVSAKGAFASTYDNVGGHYSTTNHRFTAPVAGVYIFSCAIQYGSTTGTHSNFYVNGNGHYFGDGWVDYGDANANTHTKIFKLSANDYVECWLHSPINTFTGTRSTFMGYLLG